jgi:hypothetical protein
MGSDIANPATLADLPSLLGNLIFWLLIFSGSVAVLIIIISGIRFILSGGEAKTVETAKKSMTYAILGLLLVFFSFMIVSVIGYVTHVDCLSQIASGHFGFDMCKVTGSSASSSSTDSTGGGY